MKTIITIISSVTLCLLAILFVNTSSNASSSNPPNARAGAPADASGANCSQCHTGSNPTPTTGVILSNIPSTGFVPGSTYNFSVTMSNANAYGFQLTPQTATSSTGLGTWIAGSGTSVSSKYIKHSTKGTGASHTWAFSWTAPTTATTVTFYGCFLYSNNDFGTSGDIVKLSSETYTANTSTGVSSINTESNALVVYPNPAQDVVSFKFASIVSEMKIFDINGALLKIATLEELKERSISVLTLPSGVYFLEITANEKHHTAKFVKL